MVYKMSLIAKKLRQARKVKNLSQTELSKMLNLPQSHISTIENGKTDLRLSNLEEIAQALGFEIMLVPKAMVAYVQTIINGEDANLKPRWLPDEDEDEQP